MRLDYQAFIDERLDPRKSVMVEFYRKLDDAIERVWRPGHPKVFYQGFPGRDDLKHIHRKATYLITGRKNLIKFHHDGLCLWRYDRQEQVSAIASSKPDQDLIDRLTKPLLGGLTKYESAPKGSGSVPFSSYKLLCLQEIDRIRPGDKMSGWDMCRAMAKDASASQPLVIRPHPFVTWEDPAILDRLACDHVFVAHGFKHNPVDLIEGATEVHGNSSSMLVDAMILQKPTYTHCLGDLTGGATGNIEDQNKWISWYHLDRCVDVDSPDLDEVVLERLNGCR